ncbi:MAG: histidine phosphatase family protein [Pirellulales bacterium]
MDANDAKQRIVAALGRAVDRFDWVDSATVTGSFLAGADLAGISDIDFVVIVERLCGHRFEQLQAACREALAPVVRSSGYRLRINPTLGPLKFNDAETAVLHLMVYSRAAHVEHAVNSPFTCFDWQRSAAWFKRPLSDVFAVFGLQPRHFLSSRRSVSDYLRDFRAGRVSYREMECSDTECREVCRELPMQLRDRVEFAWHIVRFLMQNFLKLIHRRNETFDGPVLCDAFLAEFPEDAETVAHLFDELAALKRSQDFSVAPLHLGERLERFVLAFERQFRRAFVDDATRHVVFRHAATAWNGSGGDAKRFLGRTDVPADPMDDADFGPLLEQLGERSFRAAFVSPLARSEQSMAALAERISLPPATCDERLLEIDYGACEGLTVGRARDLHPNLFSAWQRGDDAPFPGGEDTDGVCRRALDFCEAHWNDGDTLTCTHNVVLRSLVGQTLQVPRSLWHRLSIDHLRPYTFVQTRRYGLFADLDETIFRTTFADLIMRPIPNALTDAAPTQVRKSA